MTRQQMTNKYSPKFTYLGHVFYFIDCCEKKHLVKCSIDPPKSIYMKPIVFTTYHIDTNTYIPNEPPKRDFS